MEKTQPQPAPEPLIGGEGQRQIHLPWDKSFAIAIQNIRVRFWRSMITAAGVLLGIAFLGATFGQSIIESHTPVKNLEGLSALQAKIQKSEADTRTNWLVSMSLIVCTVGIANSMFMSVTERFKEIGTMKCLGALDSFIVRLFLLEAGFLGFIASTIGFLVGFLFAVLAKLIQLGPDVFEYLPPLEALQKMLISLVAGSLLTVLATIVPAIKAAQLPPAAALRSEI
ncbi:MAG: ABC transporter permease [Armatimonadetes bacterium]|nr:ABC transporter permease [Armatimonadota bacterium]